MSKKYKNGKTGENPPKTDNLSGASIEKTNENKSETPIKGRASAVILTVLFGILFTLGNVVLVFSVWYKNTFGITFKELLYTFATPVEGTGMGTLSEIWLVVLIPILASSLIYSLGVYFLWGNKRRVYKYLRIACACFIIASLILSLVYAVFAFRFDKYIQTLGMETGIYEDYYVDPSGVTVSGEGRNLIYIYLESMETTYASIEAGGAQQSNLIPNLTALAEENISFSDKENGLGGFHTPLGTGWTISALLATSAGIPFSFPLGENGHNKMSQVEYFAPGLTNLGDILEEKGYVQSFLCGSDAKFAGRDKYYRQHGNYEIFDLYTAREEGYIEDDYYVFWGYEDMYLYEIAKDEIAELASGDAPFNFTMLTVDTHHTNGYKCSLCTDEYGNKLENVISCADRQLYAFIEWCKSQDFYENTTIIITGDHPRMDKTLVSEVDYYDRTIYNCIINSAVEPEGDTSSRIFTSFDMFPTTLAAMGFEIEGEKLGFGVNMFSNLPTLAEEIGYQCLEDEINKESAYYIEHFT